MVLCGSRLWCLRVPLLVVLNIVTIGSVGNVCPIDEKSEWNESRPRVQLMM